MINSQIKVIKSGITYDLDFFEDQQVNLNFSVNDIRDISKRNSTYSKTITVPATKTNNTIFDNLQDINVFTEVDQVYLNKSITAHFYYNSILIRSGSVKVQKINRERDYPISYDILFVSEVATLANVLGDQYIFLNEDDTLDTDVSSLNHIFNMTNVIASWNSGDTLNYYYPLIDYTNGSNVSVGNSLQSNAFYLQSLKPALSAKYLFDKIIEDAGFTYESTFLNTTPFTKMVLPTVGKILIDVNDQEYTDRGLLYDNTSTYSVDYPNTGAWPNYLSSGLTFDHKIIDGINQMSNSSITIQKKGNYIFEWDIDFKCMRYYNQSANPPAYQVGNLNFHLMSYYQGSYTSIGGDDFTCPSTMSGLINNSTKKVERICEVGEVIYMKAVYRGDYIIYSGSTFGMISKPDKNFLYEGDVVDMTSIFGEQKYKKIDYITSIIKNYNLIVDEDPLKNKHLIIETNDIYYSGGTMLDWSYKIDNTNEEITYLPEFWGKNINLTYKKDDKDWYNRHYFNMTKKVWGQQFIEGDPAGGKDEVKVEPFFSPTALGYYGSTGLIVSKIFDADDPTVIGEQLPIGTKQDTEFNIRMLYYNNIPFTVGNTQTNMAIIVVSDGPTFYQLKGGTTNTVNFIPYAGHVDNPYGNPYFDSYNYDFGTNSHYEIQFSGSSTLTNSINYQNLYYMYYRNYLNKVMDHDAKLVTYNIKLNELDMHNFSFRNTIRIKNTNYIVNKISDWSPNELCKVELIKLSTNYVKITRQPSIRTDYKILPIPKTKRHINLPSPPASLGILFDENGDEYDTTDDRWYIGIGLSDNKFSVESNSIAQGQGNEMNDSVNSSIQGDSNVLSPIRHENINIIGSRNKII